MARKTFLELINEVSERLREGKVTSVTADEFTELLGKFVNDAKREVEDAWEWSVLRSSVYITTAASDYDYTLTGAGNRFRIIEDEYNNKPAVYNTTENSQLREKTNTAIRRLQDMSTTTNALPAYYAFEGSDTNDDPAVILYPTPNAVNTINFHLIIPQTELSDAADMLTVPWLPVVYRAWSLAISERGEDGGVTQNDADKLYLTALRDAISIDASRQNDSLDWDIG